MHRQTLWWNAQHFPTTKHTWGAAEEQEQSRLIPLTQTTVPTCVTRAGQTPIPPQLGPLPIHAVVLHDDVTESWIRHQGGRAATEMCTRSRATRKAAQEQFESGETCSGKTHIHPWFMLPGSDSTQSTLQTQVYIHNKHLVRKVQI